MVIVSPLIALSADLETRIRDFAGLEAAAIRFKKRPPLYSHPRTFIYCRIFVSDVSDFLGVSKTTIVSRSPRVGGWGGTTVVGSRTRQSSCSTRTTLGEEEEEEEEERS